MGQRRPALRRLPHRMARRHPMLLARFLPLLQDLRQSNSQTTQLLYALRPFLKEEKQPKVERAAKLAHLICIGKRFLTEGGLDIV